MSINIQIYSLIYSIVMGIILYIVCLFNYIVTKNYSPIWKYLLTLLLVIDYNLLFLTGLFYINDGIMHIYFLFLVLFAFGGCVKIMPTIRKNYNLFKAKCYNKDNRRSIYGSKRIKKI